MSVLLYFLLAGREGAEMGFVKFITCGFWVSFAPRVFGCLVLTVCPGKGCGAGSGAPGEKESGGGLSLWRCLKMCRYETWFSGSIGSAGLDDLRGFSKLNSSVISSVISAQIPDVSGCWSPPLSVLDPWKELPSDC